MSYSLQPQARTERVPPVKVSVVAVFLGSVLVVLLLRTVQRLHDPSSCCFEFESWTEGRVGE